MTMFGKLLAIEWIKLRKRSIFWVAIVVQATVLAVTMGVQQYMHHAKPSNRAFTLPDGWTVAIMTGASVGMLMLCIGVALLTSSETMWRTQRQNVIDGLSRGQYFAGKIMVFVLLALILWLDISLLALIIAPFGGAGAVTMPIFNSTAQAMLPNTLLYFIAIGATAFMFGMIASSSGAALGLLFALIIIEPIMKGIMMAQGGAWPSIGRFLPLTVFGDLISRENFDPAAAARYADMARKMDLPMPLTIQTSAMVTVMYIIAFIGIAWLTFRKRDL